MGIKREKTLEKSIEYSVRLPLSRFLFKEEGKLVEVSTRDLFRGKRVVLFGVPGAFTPTCSNNQVPDYEAAYDDLIAAGVDEVYCISVNDAYVMNAWREHLGIKKVKFIPDGNGFFTRQMGENVFKTSDGMGVRSWRYAAVIDGETLDTIEVLFDESGKKDNCESDPYENTTPAVVLKYLRESGRPKSDDDMSEEEMDELFVIQRFEDELFLK
tara:strand:+ start:3892 stop:4530 length:639 start_codon:yes stop_codon:yes gene_type:complete